MSETAKKGTQAAADQGTLVLKADAPKEKFIICEVCGQANPENTAMCKMCSNYLKGYR